MRVSSALFFLALFLPQLGCKAMLYPAARTFGSPSEGELKKCRLAFSRLKAELATARVVVFPACDPTGRKPGWDGTMGAFMANLLKTKCGTRSSASDLPPSVAPAPYKGNQMRYLWNRARAYGDWLKQSKPQGDFFGFVEIAANARGEAMGLQFYLLDATGQIAYARLLNSHHFGGKPPVGPETACERMVEVFRSDLTKEPEQVFPPYGVG